jgi:uncharacterized protein
MEEFLSTFSTAQVSVALGVFVGMLFGVFAQRSRFCLRAATVEFWRGKPAVKFTIWLFTFATALLLVQVMISQGWLQTASIRQLASTGSMSGAIVGGSLFGVGMILARGCASRLLVLSATGNQRALVAGMIVTVASQASLRGILSPLREDISGWWLVDAAHRNAANMLPAHSGLLLGLAILLGAIWHGRRSGANAWLQVGAIGVGTTVALGWAATQWHAGWSFDVVAIKSVSFTGPSADTLMGVISEPHFPMSFDIGIVMGVFVGSFLASVVSREFKLQTFTEETGLSRYIIGAVLMGFGGMLAGGCAVGAGITGGSVMAITAWVALLFMWLTAGITDALLDRPRDLAATTPPLAAAQH